MSQLPGGAMSPPSAPSVVTVTLPYRSGRAASLSAKRARLAVTKSFPGAGGISAAYNLPLLGQQRREHLGVPAIGAGPDFDDRHFRLDAEEQQGVERMAVDIAGAMLGRAMLACQHALDGRGRHLIARWRGQWRRRPPRRARARDHERGETHRQDGSGARPHSRHPGKRKRTPRAAGFESKANRQESAPRCLKD